MSLRLLVMHFLKLRLSSSCVIELQDGISTTSLFRWEEGKLEGLSRNVLHLIAVRFLTIHRGISNVETDVRHGYPCFF
jgi:hypothetical protein